MKNSQQSAIPPEVSPRSAVSEVETPRPGPVEGGTSIMKAEPASARLPPLKLQKLKHYELLELIGRGGMGDVYRARDQQTNRMVAVKALSTELTRDEQFVKRFEREARALAKLEHPHIVPVYDIDRDQGHVFYVMQYVAGESLDRRLRRAGKPTLNAALRIISQCLQALAVAHTHQLVHRDVKPGNVLLQEGNDHVYLVDFGLVRRVDSNTSFTETGVVMGTVDYMAPEQARGSANIDHRADLYAIGVMLYHLLSGHLPFAAPSFQGMLYSHAYETPQPITEVVPNLPAPLAELVTQLLAKSPTDRPANCHQVLKVIEPFLRLEVRAQHLQSELTSAADDRGPQPLQMAASIAARSRWADRITAFVGVSTYPKVQPSLQDEFHSAVAAVEQRIAYFAGLKAEGEQLCGELRQQAIDAAKGGAEVSDVEADSFHGHAESIRSRLRPIEMELNRALQLRSQLAAVAARAKLTEQWSKRSKSRVALVVGVAVSLLVSVGLVAAIGAWFGRTDNSSGVAQELPADVFLDDLSETFVHVGHGALGKHGNTGYAGATGETPVEVVLGGKKFTHALSSHPGQNDAAVVSYDLGGNYRSFTTRVGLMDKPTIGRFQGELIFRVLGDDRELWRSTSIREHGQSMVAAIDVTGIQRLSLRVECLGSHRCGWAVWLEPKLSAVAVANSWRNLLANVDIQRDRVLGTIQRKEDGIRFHPDHRTLLTLPASLPAQYDVEYEFSGFGGGGFELLLPVGDRMCNVYFGCWGNALHGIFRVRGLDHAPGAFQKGALVPGKRHHAAVQVRQNGMQATIVLWLNSEKVLAWTGDVADLSLNPAFESAQHGKASATTYLSDFTLHSARFRASAEPLTTDDSEEPRLAEISAGTQTPGSPRDVDACLQRGQEHWKRGEIAAARIDYEQLLRIAPDQHYRRGELAALCLALGDEASYRDHCQYLLSHIDDFQQPHERLSTLRIFFLAPGLIYALGEAKEQQVFDNERNSEWKDRVAILWHYRYGHWQQALDIADRYLAAHQAWRERGQCMVLRAMALWKADQQKQAKDELSAAEQYITSQSSASTKWSEAANLLYLQIYFREATALIRGKSEELNFVSNWLEQPRSVLDSAIAATPNDANRYKQRALWYAARRQWNAALSDLLEAHRRDPSNAPLTAQLATVCLLLEDKQAYAIYGSKLEQSVDRTETPWHELQVFTLCPPLAGMKPDRWLSKLGASIRRQNPTEIVSRRLIAVLYRNGRWDECISAVEKLYPDGPQMLHHAVTWLFRAMALNQRGDAEKAKQALRQIQAFIQEQKPESYLGPNSGSTISRDVKLGNWFAFDGAHVQILHREAAELILGRREEVAVAPAIADTAAAPADSVSHELTYLEKSIDSLNAAVEANSQSPDAWIRRSRWHLVRQNWKEARSDCEQYLQLKPDNMWVRREHLDLCMALEEKNPQSYYVVAEYVRSLPAGRFALGELRSLCLIPTPPGVAPGDLATWAARSGHPKTISANVYLPAVHYRAGDWQTCAAAAAQTFPNGPQGLFQVVPCLFEAAALKQLGKETEARAKLAKIRDFVEKGKSTSYPGKRDEVILNLTFDTLHSQILFREASEVILGTREELKAPLAMEIVNRESSGK